MDGTSTALSTIGFVTVVTLASLGGGVVLLAAWYGIQCARREWALIDAVVRKVDVDP